MRRTYWKSGDYSALCDVCSRKFKASQLKLRWDGLRVCSEDWEVRHPQELIRSIPDQTKLNWTRPEPTDTYIPQTRQAIVAETINITENVVSSILLFDGSIGINGSAINKSTVNHI